MFRYPQVLPPHPPPPVKPCLQAASADNEPPMAQYALAAIDSVVRFTDAGFELISSLVKPSDIIIFISE